MYRGSSAEAKPALNTAQRSQTDPASRAAAPTATTGRERRAPAAISAAPATVRAFAAVVSLPETPLL